MLRYLAPRQLRSADIPVNQYLAQQAQTMWIFVSLCETAQARWTQRLGCRRLLCAAIAEIVCSPRRFVAKRLERPNPAAPDINRNRNCKFLRVLWPFVCFLEAFSCELLTKRVSTECGQLAAAFGRWARVRKRRQAGRTPNASRDSVASELRCVHRVSAVPLRRFGESALLKPITL